MRLAEKIAVPILFVGSVAITLLMGYGIACVSGHSWLGIGYVALVPCAVWFNYAMHTVGNPFPDEDKQA